MDDQLQIRDAFNQHAVKLLGQQLWCWGQDILRPEGNWLIEFGFERTEPPADRNEFPSIYSLKLPNERNVLLRGFGVFYSDQSRGSVFWPRYEFRPKYAMDTTLACPPWSNEDLPAMNLPSKSQRSSCVALILDLIDWIRRYEVAVVEQLGIEYRRRTLDQWDCGEREVIPAEAMARDWRVLGMVLADNFPGLIKM